MASIRYVDSAATGANDGTTWANAFTTIAGAAAVDTAGDTIYVKSTHSESTAAAVTWDWAGTIASPTRIICVSDSNEPPTTVATGAVCATTGASDFTISSSSDCVYFYGMRFIAGDSTNVADILVLAGGSCFFDNCAFQLGGNNTNSDYILNGANVVMKNCTFKSSHAGSAVTLNNTGSKVVLLSCSIESGGTPGAPFFAATTGVSLEVSGFDFSNLSASASLFANTQPTCIALLRNCKMPSSWTGSVNSLTPGASSIFELVNCDSADTNYRLQRKTEFGTVTHETTLVRTGGASDGTTTISWKMVSSADAEWSHQKLSSPEIVQWVDSTGSKTATVEILHDSATNLTDKEIWVEVTYLGTSGYPLGSTINDAAANYLASAADQTDSSETWTTTGMSNPNTQKLNVTFTVNEKGFIHAVVKLAKASATVYVDPKITVT